MHQDEHPCLQLTNRIGSHRKRKDKVDHYSDDSYISLMAGVAQQMVVDALQTIPPKSPSASIVTYEERVADIERNREIAMRYVFSDEPQSEEYVFGFKFILKYFEIDVERARKAIRERMNTQFWENRDKARIALDAERSGASPSEKIEITEKLRKDAIFLKSGKIKGETNGNQNHDPKH